MSILTLNSQTPPDSGGVCPITGNYKNSVKLHGWRHWHAPDGNMAAESNGITGVSGAKYLRGANLICQQIGTDRFYYTFNAHGDIIQRIGASGAAAPEYQYDAFGNERSPVQTDPNPFRYCGEYFDTECGMIYLRNRNYAPGTGRFTSEDPARAGENWYAYCAGNPITRQDPSGLRYDDGNAGDAYRQRQKAQAAQRQSEASRRANGWAFYQSTLKPEQRMQTGAIASGYVSSNTGTRTESSLYWGAWGSAEERFSALGLWTPVTPSIPNLVDGPGVVSYTSAIGVGGIDPLNNLIAYDLVKHSDVRPNNIAPGKWAAMVASDTDDVAHVWRNVDKVGKALSCAGVAADVGIGIYDNVQEGSSWQETTSDAVVDTVISGGSMVATSALSSAIGGAITGTAVGSVAPGLGNVIGAIAGFLIGLALFYLLDVAQFDGKTLRDHAKDGISSFFGW